MTGPSSPLARAKRRVRDAATERLRGGSRTQQQNARFAELVADLTQRAEDLGASAAWSDVRFVRAVSALQVAVARDGADADRALAVALGRVAWHAEPSTAADALIEVCRQAVRVDPDLAVRVATVLWSVRRDDVEVQAVAGAANRAARRADPDAWRERAGQRTLADPVASALTALVSESTPTGPGWIEVEKALAGGADLASASAAELRRAYLGDPAARQPYLPTMRAAVARSLTGAPGVAGLQPVLDAAATELAADGRDELVAIDTVDLSGLRELVDGRSVCLVANSAALLDHELGHQIDAFDVVVRFNSFALDPVHTGVKTDVHATIHLHDFNWDVPVDLRLVFGGDPLAWAQNLRRHLRPGAQRLLGDESLRWPRQTLLGPDLAARCPVPTTGFNTLLLLDYLDVSRRIDLFGFTFHDGEPFRRDDAMHLPIAEAHSYDVEREWVAARTVDTAPGRISLR